MYLIKQKEKKNTNCQKSISECNLLSIIHASNICIRQCHRLMKNSGGHQRNRWGNRHNPHSSCLSGRWHAIADQQSSPEKAPIAQAPPSSGVLQGYNLHWGRVASPGTHSFLGYLASQIGLLSTWTTSWGTPEWSAHATRSQGWCHSYHPDPTSSSLCPSIRTPWSLKFQIQSLLSIILAITNYQEYFLWFQGKDFSSASYMTKVKNGLSQLAEDDMRRQFNH